MMIVDKINKVLWINEDDRGNNRASEKHNATHLVVETDVGPILISVTCENFYLLREAIGA